MSASVSALELLRRSEKARPTAEKSRSTVADVAGQPRYCHAICARLGKRFLFAHHHSSGAQSSSPSICGSLIKVLNGNGYVWVAENAGGRPGWVLWVE